MASRVPSAVGDFLILQALRDSGGVAVAVTDEQMVGAMHELGRFEGVSASPEGAATWCAVQNLVERGIIDRTQSVVLFNTGGALKYLELLE